MNGRLVVALSQIFTHGGIPRFNQMLCLALDDLCPKLGLDVTVLSQLDGVEDYRRHSVRWKHLRFVPGGGGFGIVRRTLALCVRGRPDLLLVGLIGMTPLGLMCRPFVRNGFGFIAHGLECWGSHTHPVVETRRSRRYAAGKARFAFSVSAYTARELSAMVGIPPDRIYLLPNTLEPSFERLEENDAQGDVEQPPELLTISRLWAEEKLKGVDHTLRAFARLAGRHPRLRYSIVGKGSDKPRLLALAESLGVSDRVRFQQDLSDADLGDLYRRCIAMVLPSAQEGFGIVFLEAMRFSKPCIGGNVGGTPEVIDHERTGFLVPFGDVDLLESSLERLLTDPDLRRTMGQAGRRRLLDCFTFDRYRERLEDNLRAVLQLG
jgi:glycosyltransferase involved in cell wall biosynthesis